MINPVNSPLSTSISQDSQVIKKKKGVKDSPSINLTHLPSDVLKTIFDYLPSIKDKLNLRICCRILNHPGFFPDEKFNAMIEKAPVGEFQKCLITEGKFIKKLTLTNLDMDIDQQLLAEINFYCPNLEELDLSCRTIKEDDLVALSAYSNLNTLILKGCIGVTGSFLAKITILPRLKQLDLTNCKNVTDKELMALSSCLNLEKIFLENCFQLTGSFLAAIPLSPNLKHPKLKYLNLKGCHHIKDEELMVLTSFLDLETIILDDVTPPGNNDYSFKGLFLAKMPSKLKHLSLLSNCKITDETLSSLVSNTQIETFVLSYNSVITGEFLKIENFSKNIKNLKLCGCENLTDENLAILVSNNQIEKISVAECSKIKGSFLAGFSSLSKLKSFELSDCRQVTDENLKFLKNCIYLEEIILYNDSKLEGSFLTELTAFNTLKAIDFTNCRHLLDENLAILSKCRQLEQIKVFRCKRITGLFLSEMALSESAETIKNINLSDCNNLIDENLVSLAYFKKLENLELESTLISASFLQSLSSSNIKKINFSFCMNLEEEYLIALDSLPKLQDVLFEENDISGSFLKIADFSNKSVYFHFNNCSNFEEEYLSHLPKNKYSFELDPSKNEDEDTVE